MLSKRCESTEVDCKIGYMCPCGLSGTKKLKYKKEVSRKMYVYTTLKQI